MGKVKSSICIGQSAAKLLSPLNQDKEKVQRLDSDGLEKGGTFNDGSRYSLNPLVRVSKCRLINPAT